MARRAVEGRRGLRDAFRPARRSEPSDQAHCERDRIHLPLVGRSWGWGPPGLQCSGLPSGLSLPHMERGDHAARAPPQICRYRRRRGLRRSREEASQHSRPQGGKIRAASPAALLSQRRHEPPVRARIARLVQQLCGEQPARARRQPRFSRDRRRCCPAERLPERHGGKGLPQPRRRDRSPDGEPIAVHENGGAQSFQHREHRQALGGGAPLAQGLGDQPHVARLLPRQGGAGCNAEESRGSRCTGRSGHEAARPADDMPGRREGADRCRHGFAPVRCGNLRSREE